LAVENGFVACAVANFELTSIVWALGHFQGLVPAHRRFPGHPINTSQGHINYSTLPIRVIFKTVVLRAGGYFIEITSVR